MTAVGAAVTAALSLGQVLAEVPELRGGPCVFCRLSAETGDSTFIRA